jgi:hypothetical protein
MYSLRLPHSRNIGLLREATPLRRGLENPHMRPMSLRAKLLLVTVAYALVLAAAIALVFARYMLYVNHPQDAAAAGGMYAAGDMMLVLMIGFMFLVPTFLLILVIRRIESLYTGYSKILVGLSLTAPICAGVLSIPAVGRSTMVMGEICMDRLIISPIVVVGLIFSRLLACFDRAKRLTVYALLIEVVTLVLMVVLFFWG